MKSTANEKLSKPFFLINLEDSNKECQQIKIYPNSNPSEIAFNFCKENNLDFTAMKFIKTNIKNILQKFQMNTDKPNNKIKNFPIKEQKNLYFSKNKPKSKKININLKIYQISPKQEEINKKIKKIKNTSQNLYHTVSNMIIPNELISIREIKETYDNGTEKIKCKPKNYSFEINENSSENGVPVLDESASNNSNEKNIWSPIDSKKKYEDENTLKNKSKINSLDIITDGISNNNRYDYESNLRLKFENLNNKKEYNTSIKKKSLSLTPLNHQEKKNKKHVKPSKNLQIIENLLKEVKKRYLLHQDSKGKISTKKNNNNFSKIKNCCYQTPINNTTLSLQFIGSVIMSNLGKKYKNQLNEYNKVKDSQISKSVSDLVDFMNTKIFSSHNNMKYRTNKNSKKSNSKKNKEKKSNNNHMKNLCLKKYTNTIKKNNNSVFCEKKILSNTINNITSKKKINDKTLQDLIANSNEKITIEKNYITTRRNHNSISKPKNINSTTIRKKIEKSYNIHKILLHDNKSRNINNNCDKNKISTTCKTRDTLKKLIKKFRSNHSSSMSTQRNLMPNSIINNNESTNQNNDNKDNSEMLYNFFNEIYFILSKNKKTISLNEPFGAKIHKLSPEVKKIIIQMVNIIYQNKKIINRNDFINEMINVYKYNLNNDIKQKLISFKKEINKIVQEDDKYDGFYHPLSSFNNTSVISNGSKNKSNTKYSSSKGKNNFVK